MEKITDLKFQKISSKEMNNINGGLWFGTQTTVSELNANGSNHWNGASTQVTKSHNNFWGNDNTDAYLSRKGTSCNNITIDKWGNESSWCFSFD